MKRFKGKKAIRSVISVLMLLTMLVSNTFGVIAADDIEDAPGSHRLEIVGVEGVGAAEEAPKTPVSYSTIEDMMKKAGGYSYFTKYFEQAGHTEATIGADTAQVGTAISGLQIDAGQGLMPSYNPTTQVVNRKNYTMGNMVWVEHTFEKGADGSMKGVRVTLGIRSSDGAIDLCGEAETNEQGVAKYPFYVPNGEYEAYVKYNSNESFFNENGVLASGENVTFPVGKITVNNKYGDNVSYFNNVTFGPGAGLNNPGAMVAGSGAAYSAILEMKNRDMGGTRLKLMRVYDATKGEGGYSVIDFNSTFKSLVNFSQILANSKSSDTVNVFDVNSDSLAQNPHQSGNYWDEEKQQNLPYAQISFGGKDFVVVNVEIRDKDISGGRASINLRGAFPMEASSDFNAAYDYKDDHSPYFASRTLLNFVQRDADGNLRPFTGVLKLSSQTEGIVFAPAATVYQSSNVSGSIVADKIYMDGMELHALSFLSDSKVEVAKIVVGDKAPEEEEEEEPVVKDYGFKVNKTDEDGKSLDGAVFAVYKGGASGSALTFTKTADGAYKYDPEGSVTEVTTKDGTMTITGLAEAGVYSIKELETPEGDDTFIYTYDKQVSTITVDENTENGDPLVIVNKREDVKGSLSVRKVVTGQGPADDNTFYFTVKNVDRGTDVENPAPFNSSNSKVFSVAKGSATVIDDLIPGEYKVTETDKNGKALGDDFDYITSYSPSDGTTKVRKDETGEVTIKNEKINYKGKIILKKVADDGTVIPGVSFKIYKDGEPYGEYKTGSDGTIKFEDLPLGDYYLEETWSSDEYEVPTGDAAKTKTISITKNHLEDEITVENKKIVKGSVKVNKTDGDGKALTGAQFELTRKDGTKVPLTGSAGSYSYSETGTEGLVLETGSDASFTVKDLPVGDYTVCETKTPAGYFVKVDATNFSVTKADPDKTLEIRNSKISANIKLHKIDDADPANDVEGAEFKIVRVLEGGKTQDVSTITTGADGMAEYTGLAEGDYYVQETKAPEGYLINSEPVKFSVTKDISGGQIDLGDIVDKCGTGKVTLKKIDFSTGNAMQGVKFDVYRKSTFLKIFNTQKHIAAITTDASGMASLDGLLWGEYRLVEQKVEGYEGFEADFVIDAEHIDYRFTEEEGCAGAIRNKREKHTVTLTKVDSTDAKKTLPGAVFNLYKAKEGNIAVADTDSDPVLSGLTTDAHGVITISDLESGTYYLMEKSAPKGYVLDGTRQYKVVSGGTESEAKIVVTNERKLGTVTIKKVDEDGKALPGATFTMFSTTCPDEATLGQKLASWIFKSDSIWYVVGEAISDSEGNAVFENVEWGDYVIGETVVPKGYVRTDSSSITDVSIGEGKQDYTYTVVNDKEEEEEEEEEKDSSSSSEEVKDTSSSSEEVKDTSSSSEEVKDTSSSSEEVKDTSSSSEEVKDTSSSSEAVKKSSSSSSEEEKSEVKSSSEAVKKSSSSSSEEEKSEVKSSSEAVKKSSSSSSEAEKSVVKSSSEAVKKSSSSSSEAEKSVVKSSSEKKAETSSSKAEVKKTETSSSKAEEKKTETSSSEKKDVTTSSSEQKTDKTETSSSSKSEEESSDTKDNSSSSETVKETESSSSDKEEVKTSSSSEKKVETASSSDKAEDKVTTSSSSKSEEQTSDSKDDTSSKKKHKKDKDSDDDDDDDDNFDDKGRWEEDGTPASGGKGKVTVIDDSGNDTTTTTTVIDKIAGVLGVCAAPEGPQAGVLGDIAAPLTGDDMNPVFWLMLAGFAAAILGVIIAVTKRRRS